MTPALLGLLLLSGQQAQPAAPQLGQVSISGEMVPITVPEGRRPFAQSSKVTVSGRTFVTVSQNELGPQVVGAGGWSDLSGLAIPSPEGSPAGPRILVFVFSDSLINNDVGTLARGRRRSTIAGFQLGQIKSALGRVAAMVRASGVAQPTFDLVNDTAATAYDAVAGSARVATGDLGTITPQTKDDGSMFGPAFVRDMVGPWLNGDKFESDDPRYFGPYHSVLIVHAGMVSERSYGMLGSTPFSVLPFWGGGSDHADETLALDFYAAFVRAHGSLQPGSFLNVEDPGLAPRLVHIEPSLTRPVPEDLTFGGKSLADLPRTNEPVGAGYGSTLFMSGSKVAATGPGVFLLKDRETRFKSFSVGKSKFGSEWIVGELAEPVASLSAWLGTDFTVTAVGDPASQPQNTLRPDLDGFGDFSGKLADEGGRKVIAIHREGISTRGYLVLTRNRFDPVIAEPKGKSLSFEIKSKGVDDYALSFWGKDGELVGSALLHGNAWQPAELAAAEPVRVRAMFDDAWHEVKVPLDQVTGPVYAVTFGAPPHGARFNRVTNSPEDVWMTLPSVVEGSTPSQDMPSAVDSFWASAGALNGKATQEQLAFVTEAEKTANPLIALQAAVVRCAGLDDAGLPAVLPTATGVEDASTFVAVKAIGRLGGAASQDALLEIVKFGPWELTRQIAMQYLPETLPGDWTGTFNIVSASRDWHNRAVAARLSSRCPSPGVQVMLSTALEDPDPRVRFEIVRLLQPENGMVVRRMHFQAVNDPSEWVRATGYVGLLQASDQNAFNEAVMATRDDSKLVKLTVLGAMAAKPKAEFRSGVQAAMLDKDPDVLVAAMQAFAALPGGVAQGEVATALTSNDPRVQLGLLQLAKAKGISLPVDLLDRLSASLNGQVAALAKALRSGS